MDLISFHDEPVQQPPFHQPTTSNQDVRLAQARLVTTLTGYASRNFEFGEAQLANFRNNYQIASETLDFAVPGGLTLDTIGGIFFEHAAREDIPAIRNRLLDVARRLPILKDLVSA